MELTANAQQTVDAGNNVIFTDVPVNGSNKCIIHRDGSGLILLRGITNQCNARFKVSFGGNIAIPEDGDIGPISLTLSLNGESIDSTRMIVTPTSTGEYNNVSSHIYIKVPKGCCMNLSVKNVNTQSIFVSNANLIVERVA